MIKVILDFIQFLLSCAPLLTSTAIFALSGILLAKSIKKHPGIWYSVFAIPFILVAVPTILRWCGSDINFSFTRVPVLGQIIRDYIHMGTFGHPLLIVIMYMGALDTRRPAVKKLMSIRKELSIISGFPIFTHSLIRVANNFPASLKYFTDNAGYMENSRVASPLGAGISNFSLVVGILLLALFIPLWITSFDKVHRRMGNVKWKKLQRWSYVLYALLFIHAMGIQVGGLMNPRGGNAQRPATETVAEGRENSIKETDPAPDRTQGRDRTEADQSATGRRETSAENRPGKEPGQPGDHQIRESGPKDKALSGEVEIREEGNRPRGDSMATQRGSGEQNTAPQARQSGRRTAKGFGDMNVNSKTRGYIQVATLLLIYGSYLYLRIRKARRNAKKRAAVRA
ncbi:MAG: hypothetical protein LIO77_11120 [Rikenellaceae bacterium]|nr:hypothetical protein [Rikenellaceae bacterium]